MYQPELAAVAWADPPARAAEATVILIVDDDPIVRSLLRDTLEDAGFLVREAADGMAACRSCDELVPALLVVDVVMPHMDGFELCRRLRRGALTQHVPILMATGLDDTSSIARAYEVGATDFISKPLNWLILTQRIRYMLRSTRTADDLRENQARLSVAEEQQRAQNQRFEAALDNMSQGLCMFGADGGLIVSNRRFQQMYQLAPASVTPGLSLTEVFRGSPLFAGEANERAERCLAEHVLLAGQRTSATLGQELADGRVITIAHEPMAGGGFVDTFSDVTEQRLAEAQIAHLALHDPLTDLPNRALFRQRLEEALRRLARGVPCAVLCLDLDQFKGVNDTLGHPVGDALLKSVTERLRSVVRQSDTIARLGGDEFAIVHSGADHPTDTTALAARLLYELSRPFNVAGHHVTIGTSIGIAVAPAHDLDPDQLLQRADMALYQAKTEGRNRYRYFEPEMGALMHTRRMLEQDLRNAVVAQEFELYYQPLVNLHSERIIGFEALLRWNSPRRGIVPPGEFIPIAEEIGQIVQIGEWVLHTACREAMTWPDELKVAVNISALQFKSGKLLQTVTHALRRSGLDPRRLELEVTESVMIDNFDAVMSLLHELKNLGVGIAMDDFGTGYSSLSYLRSFPFDKIKIDQSFVRDLGKKSDSIAIIRAVTGMCDSMGVAATAEGVETEQQLAMLNAERCTEVQGYLVSRPRPARDVPELLAAFARDGLQGVVRDGTACTQVALERA
jgi:diguanylate cyclase (GGDEF)-like protein